MKNGILLFFRKKTNLGLLSDRLIPCIGFFSCLGKYFAKFVRLSYFCLVVIGYGWNLQTWQLPIGQITFWSVLIYSISSHYSWSVLVQKKLQPLLIICSKKYQWGKVFFVTETNKQILKRWWEKKTCRNKLEMTIHEQKTTSDRVLSLETRSKKLLLF